MKTKIIPQVFTTPQGIRRSYGIIINNVPRFVFESREEVNCFLKGVKGNGA